ncbi:hypothetical protein NM688_g8255 [Phlebia brevispora]|uniref:Uncharacterized protein n=1 Tax=Phlebia brevispora TaxID=194682 RepID=A0ACC1RV99_9APHY|nr:hypothetical protein NM688_g8255 [Phlebia brevispora]
MVEKIWEGTINVCALDLARAVTKERKAIEYYLSWARSIVAAVPSVAKPSLAGTTEMLTVSLTNISIYFREITANDLLPCLVLNHFALVSSALYLLEHASWAYANHEPTRDIDVEAVRRWVEEGDLAKVEREIALVRADGGHRLGLNTGLVYGAKDVSAKL